MILHWEEPTLQGHCSGIEFSPFSVLIHQGIVLKDAYIVGHIV